MKFFYLRKKMADSFWSIFAFSSEEANVFRLAVLCYLALINILSFVSFFLDKRYAKKHRDRIPEARLLSQAALGGSFGALLAMMIFHHKTLHKRFCIGIPIMFLIQLALLILWVTC